MSLQFLYTGKTIEVTITEAAIANLIFVRHDDSFNRLDIETREELKIALESISSAAKVKGLVISSNSNFFLVGADLNEFESLFNKPHSEIIEDILAVHDIVNTIEDFDFPTVSLINGVALGGGFEIALATDYRIIEEKAKVGFPEVSFGIIPAWGGTVRLSRVIGLKNAIQWIASANNYSSEHACSVGAVDEVVTSDDQCSSQMMKAAIKIIEACSLNELDFHNKRKSKIIAMDLSDIELRVIIEEGYKQVFKHQFDENYAPTEVLNVMVHHSKLTREKAQLSEAITATNLATQPIVLALINKFLNTKR